LIVLLLTSRLSHTHTQVVEREKDSLETGKREAEEYLTAENNV
jgi:hypothetical protein